MSPSKTGRPGQDRQRPLQLGILGCANIARQFARDVAGSPAVEMVAVASRELAKAQGFASQFGLPQAHGSYEALLADPQIEAVYIPLPNHLHAPWAIQAAEAGKHVLCEKPLAMTTEQSERMLAAAAHIDAVIMTVPVFTGEGTLRALLAADAKSLRVQPAAPVDVLEVVHEVLQSGIKEKLSVTSYLTH